VFAWNHEILHYSIQTLSTPDSEGGDEEPWNGDYRFESRLKSRKINFFNPPMFFQLAGFVNDQIAT